MSSAATRRSSTNTATAARDEDRSDAPVIGELDGDARERATDQRGRDDVGPARPVPLVRDLVAEQRRDRHVMGAAERP